MSSPLIPPPFPSTTNTNNTNNTNTNRSPNELCIIEKFVGVDPADLGALDEKAKQERKEREEKRRKKGAAGGGGANKDCRGKVKVAEKRGGKGGKWKKEGKKKVVDLKWKKKKKKKKEEDKDKDKGKKRSQSMEDMLNGALGSRR